MSENAEVCREVLITLRRIIQGIDRHSRELVRDYGLTGPQLILLEELSTAGQITVGTLARSVNLSPATVTDILLRLEKRGFVERSRSSADKRHVLVGMTELGERILENAPPLLQEHFVAEFKKLEDWEQTLILSSLQRVASMMEVRELEASPLLISGPIGTSYEETTVESPPHSPPEISEKTIGSAQLNIVP